MTAVGWLAWLWRTRDCGHLRRRRVYGDDWMIYGPRYRCLDCPRTLSRDRQRASARDEQDGGGVTPYVSHSDVLAAFPDVPAGRKPIRVDSQGWDWGWTCHRHSVIGVGYADHASALAAALDHCREESA